MCRSFHWTIIPWKGQMWRKRLSDDDLVSTFIFFVFGLCLWWMKGLSTGERVAYSVVWAWDHGVGHPGAEAWPRRSHRDGITDTGQLPAACRDKQVTCVRELWQPTDNDNDENRMIYWLAFLNRAVIDIVSFFSKFLSLFLLTSFCSAS